MKNMLFDKCPTSFIYTISKRRFIAVIEGILLRVQILFSRNGIKKFGKTES